MLSFGYMNAPTDAITKMQESLKAQYSSFAMNISDILFFTYSWPKNPPAHSRTFFTITCINIGLNYTQGYLWQWRECSYSSPTPKKKTKQQQKKQKYIYNKKTKKKTKKKKKKKKK